jgi:hypothetical protein
MMSNALRGDLLQFAIVLLWHNLAVSALESGLVLGPSRLLPIQLQLLRKNQNVGLTSGEEDTWMDSWGIYDVFVQYVDVGQRVELQQASCSASKGDESE